ncbi:GTP-binding protein Rho1 [Balamuthia mandrillaris]
MHVSQPQRPCLVDAGFETMEQFGVSPEVPRLASSNAVWKPVYFATSYEHDMRTGTKTFEKCGTGEIDYWGGSPGEVQQEMFDAFLPHGVEGEHPLVVSPLTLLQDGKELANKERHPRQEGRVKDGVLSQTNHFFHYDFLLTLSLIKVVVMGNLGVGKTSLVAKLSNGRGFDPSHADSIPEKFDNHCVRMFYGTQEVRVSLWDTEMWDTSFSLEGVRIEEGGEDYRRMRLITYPNTDVFLLCFDLTDMESFRYLESKWACEAIRYAPYTPYIMVVCGTKSDLKRTVSKEEALACAKRIGAYAYLECSTDNNNNNIRQQQHKTTTTTT